MAGLDDPPIDPAATDQLAAALGQPSELPAFPPVPDYWGADAGAGALPPAPSDASAGAPPVPPGDQGPAPGPPPAMPEAPPTGVAAMPDITIHTEQPGELAPPDAITGAGGTSGTFGGAAPELTPGQQYQQVAQGYQTHPEQLLAKLTAGGPLDESTQRYLNDFARRDPGGFAELQAHVGDARLKFVAAEQHRIADHDWQVQQQNIEMRNRAIADAHARTLQLDARAQELANTKIGQLSIGQRIAGVAAAVIGGLYQGKTGSARNPGLDAFNDAINRDVENQKLELANKRDVLGLQRSAIGEEYARSGDAYQAAETMRIAALKHADDVLATQQQDFAADGTRGIQIAQLRAGIAGQQQQALQAFSQKQFENSVKLQNAAREQQLASETQRHNRAEESLAWTKEAREGAKVKADNAVLTPQQIHQQFPDVPVTAIPQAGATVGDMAKRQDLYNKSQEANAKGRENAVNEAATIVRNPITKEPIVDSKTGQPARLDKEQASKFTDEIGKAQQFMDGMADVRRDLETDPSMWDRKKWAAVTAKYEHAKTRFIGEVGAKPSSREMQAVEEMFGTNFDGFTARVKDKGTAIGRIDALMDLTQGDTLTDANLKLGYDGKPILRDPRQFATHANTPEQQAEFDVAERLKEKPNISYDAALDQAVHFQLSALPPSRSPADTTAAMAAARAEAQQYKDISPQQRHDLAMLGERAAGGDPGATATLRDLAKTAHAKTVRELAAQAYDRASSLAGEQTARDVFGAPTDTEPPPSYDTPSMPPWHPATVLPTFPGAQ